MLALSMLFLCWLKDNSAALQAIGGLGTLIITVPVLVWNGLAARRAAASAEKQANAADAQVAAAQASSKVSEEHLQAARDSAAAEREHSEIIKSQLLASLRPIVVFSWSEETANSNFDVEERELLLTNQSVTAVAMELEV
jgi:hypothetical protein